MQSNIGHRGILIQSVVEFTPQAFLQSDLDMFFACVCIVVLLWPVDNLTFLSAETSPQVKLAPNLSSSP